jgi:hypothetical protein
MRRLLVGGIAIVVVAVVIVLIIHATGGSDTAATATTTTGSPRRNLTAPPAAIAALKFTAYKSTTPAFTVQTPGPGRREVAAEAGNFRFGPGAGAQGRWTLYVLPAAPGVDLKSELTTVVGAKGGTAAPMADSGSPGAHLDEMITSGRTSTMVHVASGTANVFVLAVPRLSGGSVLNGRAIFNQMAGSLRAPGIGIGIGS